MLASDSLNGSALLTSLRSTLRRVPSSLPSTSPFIALDPKVYHATLLLRNVISERRMKEEDLLSYFVGSSSFSNVTPRLIILKKLHRLLGYAVQLQTLDALVSKIDPTSGTVVLVEHFVNSVLQLPVSSEELPRDLGAASCVPTAPDLGTSTPSGGTLPANDIYPDMSELQMSQLFDRNQEKVQGIVAARRSRRRKLRESVSSVPVQENNETPKDIQISALALARAASENWKYTKYNVRTAAYLNYDQQQLRTHASHITVTSPSSTNTRMRNSRRSNLNSSCNNASSHNSSSSPLPASLISPTAHDNFDGFSSKVQATTWETSCFSCWGVGLAQVSDGRIAAGISPLPSWARLPLLALRQSFTDRRVTLLQGFNALDCDNDSLLSVVEFQDAFHPAALRGEWWEATNVNVGGDSNLAVGHANDMSLMAKEHAHAIFGLADLVADRRIDFAAFASLVHRAYAARPAGATAAGASSGLSREGSGWFS
jgi:hypothetical protein